MSEVLARLDAVIAERRRSADPATSYVAKLCHGGLDRILKKVAEESGETLLAAKNVERGGDRRQLALWDRLGRVHASAASRTRVAASRPGGGRRSTLGSHAARWPPTTRARAR